MTIRVVVEVPNAKPLAAKFGQGDARVRAELQKMIAGFGARIVADLKVYPPERPGQTYVRTGRLGEGWQPQKAIGPGVRVVNTVDYARWVQGTEQAWMHQGRWLTYEQELAKLAPEIAEQSRAILANLQAWIASK